MTNPESVDDLIARIRTLEASQRTLSQRVAQLEAEQAPAVDLPAVPPPAAPAEISAPPPPLPSATPASASPPPPTPELSFDPQAPPPPPSAQPSSPPASIETLLRIAGAALIGLAALFLVNTAISRGYITPEIQLLGATMLGAACLAAGLWLRDKERWGSTLAIVGVAIVTTCAGAGHGWLELYGPATAIALTSVASIVGAAVALRLADQWVATTASLTLLAVPTWFGVITEAPLGLVGLWVVTFALAVTALSLNQRWGWYQLISTWSIGFWLAALFFVERPEGSQVVFAYALIAVVASVLWLNPVLGSSPMVSRWRSEESDSQSLVSDWHNASATAVPLWAWNATSAVNVDESGIYTLALGLGFVAISVLAWRLTSLISPMLLSLKLLGALIVTALGALIFLDGSPVPVVFLGLAIASYLAAQSLERNVALRVAAAILAAIATLGIVIELIELTFADGWSEAQNEVLSVLAGLAIGGLGAWLIQRWEQRNAAELADGYLALVTGGLVLALTVALTPDRLLPETLLTVAVGFAAVMLIASSKLGRQVFRIAVAAGAAAMAGALVLTLASIAEPDSTTAGERIAVLVALVAAGVATWRLWAYRQWRDPAFLATWTLAYGWVLSVFLPLDEGQFGVSMVWAAAAVAGIWFGVRQRDALVRTVGLISLGVVIIKLLTVDLAEIDTLWRVLLFLVIGLGLLRLAYLLPKLERRAGADRSSRQ